MAERLDSVAFDCDVSPAARELGTRVFEVDKRGCTGIEVRGDRVYVATCTASFWAHVSHVVRAVPAVEQVPNAMTE